MRQDPVDSLRRRRLLAGLGTGVVAYGAGVGVTAAQSSDLDEISVTLDNVGASAWEVTETSDNEFAETGVENPELTFRVGSRYTIQNDGWSIHPLEFRDSDGDPLLSQDAQGSFEGDSEINWVDNGDSVAFTVTSELAAELSSYICTIHFSMEGATQTIDQTGTERSAEVTMSDQSTDGVTVTVDSARLSEGGFITIHDSSLRNGATLESVRGTSEYLEAGSVQDLDIELDDPLTSGDTLIAMAHRDTNDNQTYEFVSSDGNADGPYMNDSGAITSAASVQVADASVTFPRQATASPTFTQGDVTSPGVAVTVSSNVETAVVVTYESNGDLIIAGLGVFGADRLNGEEPVTIAVEDAGGFPGEHTAHAIPASELSGQYAPGDAVSMETANAVVDNDTTTVHQATLTFEDQTADNPVESGDTVATVDSSLTGDVTYTVDVHVTDDEDGLVATEWIGSTNVLAGDNEGSEIIAERVPEDGEFNELPFSGTDTFVAMIHLATDASAGDAATPETGPVVRNVSGESGAVPGGVTATAELTAESGGMDNGSDDGGTDDGDDGDMDGSDGGDGGMDNGDDDSGMNGGDDGDMDSSNGDDGGMDSSNDSNGGDSSSDDGGPGFGPIAGVAGLGGLATYAYRKLNLDSEPPTPEDDDLDDSDE